MDALAEKIVEAHGGEDGGDRGYFFDANPGLNFKSRTPDWPNVKPNWKLMDLRWMLKKSSNS